MRCAAFTEQECTDHTPGGARADQRGGVAFAPQRSTATILRCRMCGRGMLEAIGSVDAHRYFHCRHCDFSFAVLDGECDIDTFMSLSGPGEVDVSFLKPALDRLSHRKSLRILDYGGRDSIAPHLLRQAGHRVIAFDLMPGARQHPDRISGDILQRNIPEAQFDLVYAYHVFEHLAEPAPVLRELLRLARPGGLVLIHTDMNVAGAPNGGGNGRWAYRIPPDVCSIYRPHTFEVFLRGSTHQIIHHDAQTIVIQRDAA